MTIDIIAAGNILAEVRKTLNGQSEGFTLDPKTGVGADLKNGFMVATGDVDPIVCDPEADAVTMIEEARNILKMAGVAMHKGAMLGGWRNPETGKVEVEPSYWIKSEAAAWTKARECNQLAYFDVATGEAVMVE